MGIEVKDIGAFNCPCWASFELDHYFSRRLMREEECWEGLRVDGGPLGNWHHPAMAQWHDEWRMPLAWL